MKQIILYFLLLGLLFFVFYADTQLDNSLRFASFYTLVILYTWVLPTRFITETVAVVCTLLVVVASVMGGGFDQSLAGLNLGIDILVIWVMTSTVIMAKHAIRNLEESKHGVEIEVKKRTAEMLSQQNQLQSIYDVTQDYCIILLDKDGCILTWDEGAAKFMNYQENEMIGRSHAVFYTDQDRDKNLHFNVLKEARKKGVTEIEGLRYRNNKESFYARVTTTAITDARNEVVGYTLVIRDVSMLKDLEEVRNRQIALSAKNVELEKFAYHTSHDLQEPLRTVQSYVEVLREDYDERLDDEGREVLTVIEDSVVRMREMIKGLLNYSRLDSETEIQKIDLNVLCNQIIGSFEQKIKETNCEIIVQKLPVLEGYLFPIQQLVMNLISNAIKFSQYQHDPRVEVYSQINDHNVFFYVKDNGIGIEDKYQAQIFELFTRLNPNHKFEGTGLGLAQCKKIVDLHHGRIKVTSKENQGSLFEVSLPLKFKR